MTTIIKVDVPDLDPDAEVLIDRLGVFSNGAEFELTDEEVDEYERVSGVPFDESDKFLAVASVVTTPTKKPAKKAAEKPEGSDS